jgi:hypothetical protein
MAVNGLPPGFVLDEDIPAQSDGAGSGLPPGFVLDSEQASAAGADPVAALDFKSFGTDWKAAKAAIDHLPEQHRARARDAYAGAVVEAERAGGGVGQTVNDYVRRAASSVPGVGKWADEGNAMVASLLGGDYDLAHAYERAQDRAIDKTETTKLGTLPVVGDVTTGGLTKAAGTVGGAVAMPFARFMPGAGALPMAANVGGNAAVYGALDAAGDANAGERGAAALKGGAEAAAYGAPLGAVVGKFVGRGAPAAADDIASAAEKAGVELPRVAATGDGLGGWSARQVAGALSNVPIVGSPLTKASGKAIEQIEGAAGRIADDFAPGSSAVTAGDSVKHGISDWIKVGSAKASEKLYEGVGAHIPAEAMRPLRATQEVFEKLGVEDIRSASTVNKTATDLVKDALKRPGGLSFEGLLKLRTNVGAMIDDGMLPNAGTAKPGLKRIYEGLSKDLEAMAFQHGGGAGVRAWQEATKASKIINREREALTKIIGRDGLRSGESTVETLVRMAGTRSTADIGKLTLARRVLSDDTWDEVAATAIHRLGRNQADDFSAAQFLKNYSALNDDASKVLFGSTGKGHLKTELDSLARVVTRFKNLEKMGNPSGTGRVASLLAVVGAAGAGGPLGLLVLLGKAVAAHQLARYMAQPAKVKEITKFADSVYRAATSPAGEAILQPAVMGFSRVIANDSGEDEQEVANRINEAMRGQ